jgi:hypothetical protein
MHAHKHAYICVLSCMGYSMFKQISENMCSKKCSERSSTHTNMHINTAYLCIVMCVYACVRVCMHTYINTCMNTYTNTHTHTLYAGVPLYLCKILSRLFSVLLASDFYMHGLYVHMCVRYCVYVSKDTFAHTYSMDEHFSLMHMHTISTPAKGRV